MLKMVQNLTEEQDKILRSAFSTIDTDQSGFLDPSEIRVFLSIKWKELVSPETIESIVLTQSITIKNIINNKKRLI